MSFAIVSMARTGSTAVYRVLCSDTVVHIAYEPDFTLPDLSVAAVRERCRNLFNEYSAIKYIWDPNGWPFRNANYVSTIENLGRSEELLEFNATVANFPDKVVVLRRRNQFSRVMSDLLGQQSNLWGHNPDEIHTEAEAVQYRRNVLQRELSPVNSEVVEWYMTNAWRQEEALLSRIPEERRLVVFYEDLFDDLRWKEGDFTSWTELAFWVGVRPRFREKFVQNIINPTNKYNSEEVYKKIPNYKLLEKKFAG